MSDEEENQLESYPETIVELQKDIYTPDKSNIPKGKQLKKYYGTIFKEINLANFDRLDQKVVMAYQSIEETLLSWGLDETSALFNAEKQAYVSSTRAIAGFERVRQTTQSSGLISRSQTPQGRIVDSLRPKTQETEQQQIS